MWLFKKWKRKKLIDRFLELDEKRIELELMGCMKRSCEGCYQLVHIDEYHSTCNHEIYGMEMWDIYNKLFPDDTRYKYSWAEKVRRVKGL